MKEIVRDLKEEYEALDTIVSGLDEKDWYIKTPFFNWTAKDTISHLVYYDNAAMLSATDAAAFEKHTANMLSGITNYDELHIRVNSVGGNLSIADLLSWWRKERKNLISAYESLDPKTRLPWYGPTMSARSSAVARMMETWAHGQDIVDAFSISRTVTNRLKHISHLGVATLRWSFSVRQLEVPNEPVRVELTGPSGDLWTWGPEDAENIICGTAEDFCLLVSQRRNIIDTGIVYKGDVASKWVSIAQIFAGPPEEPPKPGYRKINKDC